MFNLVLLIYYLIFLLITYLFVWANDGNWTHGLFLTKEALYPWATPAAQTKVSGRRGSNSRHSAWKADALPTELLPLISFCGESRIRTCEGKTNRFTVCPRWPLEYLPNNIRADGGIRTPDQLITNQLLWPTELYRLIILIFSNAPFSVRRCKYMTIF